MGKPMIYQQTLCRGRLSPSGYEAERLVGVRILLGARGLILERGIPAPTSVTAA